jgi:hypothetical protein
MPRHLVSVDLWLPVAAGRSLDDLGAGVRELRRQATEQGRSRVPVTAAFLDPSGDDLARAAEIGVDRALIMIPDGAGADDTLRLLDRYAGLVAP